MKDFPESFDPCTEGSWWNASYAEGCSIGHRVSLGRHFPEPGLQEAWINGYATRYADVMLAHAIRAAVKRGVERLRLDRVKGTADELLVRVAEDLGMSYERAKEAWDEA